MKKRVVAIVLLVLLLVPYAAWAGQAPSAQHQTRYGTENGAVSGSQDVGARTAYGGVYFWYQYYQMLRWWARWGVTF
jgi:hypothetical protein